MRKEFKIQGRKASSRWRDDYVQVKPNLAITNLINAMQNLNNEVADRVYDGNIDNAKQYAESNDRPLEIINRLLQKSNLPITLTLRNNDEVRACKKDKEYNIAHLSDGERNVILMASQVLTAPQETIILIDEPERHLHRSIISPLLTALFAERSNCIFIVATHEVMLPMDNLDSKILLVRDCKYGEKEVDSWDTDLLEHSNEIDEEIMRDILGARRRLLFVEGTEHSLDKPLYSLILPDVSIIPKQDSKSVENAVKSIRDLQQLHWVVAYGIVDKDTRTPDDVKQLKEHGIYSLDVHSVESIYYNLHVRKVAGEQMAKLIGADATTLLEDAKNNALKAINHSAAHLIEQKTKHAIRQRILEHLPNRNMSVLNKPICICVDASEILKNESERLNKAIENRDLDFIISSYPVRESSALCQLAKGLKYQGRKEYELAVIKLLEDKPQVLAHIKSLLGTLSIDIEQ